MLIAKRYGVLIAMTAAFSMITLDNSIVSIAMPYMQGDLDLSKTHLIWIFNAYILTFATGVAVCGRLGDVFGHVKMFVWGISIFTIASAICGIAPSGEILILARILQAVGAALLQPSSITLVFHQFEGKKRAKALAIYIGCGLAFLGMGPIIGGFLTSFLSWRWIFYINIPIALIATSMLYFYRPDSEKLVKTRIDRYGILLIILALPLLILPFEQINEWGAFSFKTIGSFVSGMFFLIWFYRHEKKHPDPIIDVKIFHNKLFFLYSVILCSATFALLGSSLFNAIYLQNVMGFEPYVAGFYLLFMMVPNIVSGQFAAHFYGKMGLSVFVIVGTLMMAVSFMGLAYFMMIQDLNMMIVFYVLAGTGTGIIMSPLNTHMMDFVPRHRTGEISGLLQTLRLMGGTVGVAFLSSFIVFYENISLTSVIEKYQVSKDYIMILKRLLSESLLEQMRLAQKITNAPEALLLDLKMNVAISIGKGFMVSSLILFISVFLTIIAYRLAKINHRN